MRSLFSLLLAVVVAISASFLAQGQVAYAAFHCVRIHAVAGGLGDNTVQYVELRMDMAGQVFLGGHSVQFFDSSGTLKATFTFPAGVTNGSVGDSVLIATSEFNTHVTGGTSDFTFSGANTTGANGGDPLHPVQPANGSVVWAGPNAACATLMAPVDSVAYGLATATYGTAATTLPNPGAVQALRLSNLNAAPTSNFSEYSLQNVSNTTFAVAPANLASDYRTPRNNARTVLKVNAAVLGGLDQDRNIAAVGGSKGRSVLWYEVAAGVAAAAVGAGWYVLKVRAA